MQHSQRLIHLSHEHDSALKLATALRALTPEDESSLPRVAEQIRTSFAEDTLPHFEEEERLVVPRLIAMGRQDLVDRMREEHLQLHKLADALAQPTVEGIRAFAAMVTAHVSFEENILWEVLEPGAGAAFETPPE